MSYNIKHTDNGSGGVTIILDDNQLDTSTSLTLVGKGNTNYGAYLWTDFVRLLENFYGPTQPDNPITGQLWYNSTTNTIYVNKITGGAVTGDNLSAANGSQWSPLADHAYLSSTYNIQTIINSAVDGLTLRLNNSDVNLKAALETIQTGKYLSLTGGTVTGRLQVPQLTPGTGNTVTDPKLTANQYLAVGWTDMNNYVQSYVADRFLTVVTPLAARVSALEAGGVGGGAGGAVNSPGAAISGYDNLSYGIGYDPNGSTSNYIKSAGSATLVVASTTQYVNTNLSVPVIDPGDVDAAHDSYATPKSYVDGRIISGTLLASSNPVFTAIQVSAKSIVLPEFPSTVLPGGTSATSALFDNHAVTKKYVDLSISGDNITNILSTNAKFKSSLASIASGATAVPAIPTTNFSGRVLAINSSGSGLEWIASATPITNGVGLSSASYVKQGNNMLNVFGTVMAASLRRSANIFSNNIQPWETTVIIPNNFTLSVPYDVHATFTPNPATQSTTGFIGTMNCYVTAMTATSFTLGIICNPAALTNDRIAYTINGLVTN